jgi:hypothetical protein
VQHLRLDHDPERQLLQVRELRDHFWLRLTAQPLKESGIRNRDSGLSEESEGR